MLGVEGSELPVELYDNGMRHIYVALPSEKTVASVRPDLSRLAAELPPVLGISTFAGSGYRWKTRMFAPAGCVPEGAEIGRPSTLYARAEGSADEVTRVDVGGSAVVVARGEFRLPV